MNAGKAVYGILSANSGVTDIVGTRIFPEIAEQEAATPFIVYQLLSVDPEDTHDGPSKLDEVRFEFLCYADSYNAAADLGVAVRAALDRVSGTYNAVNVESVQFNDVDVEIEYDPRRYSQVLKFTFRIKRDDVTIALGTPVTGAVLGDLSDVDVTGVTNGQLIAYNSTSGNWEAANDAGGAEELDDLSDVKIVGTPSEGDALVYQSGFFQLGQAGATTLGDLSDVNTTGAAAGSLISYNGVDGWEISAGELPSDQVYYHNRYASEAETLLDGATETVELYYTAQADGDGLHEDAQTDTATTGYDIRRKLYYAEKAQADPNTSGDWTQFTAIADNTTFANAKAALLAYLKERTGGTVPISLKQTWEEVAQAPAFTGLLNESYGSGASAAYSTRRLNGNVTECMVIRRASDSTTTTIGFDGSGNIDESAINTFCSGTTCTVYQWLDQSGNGNTATAAAQANEPTIYTGGAIVKEAGQAAVSFDGASTYLTFSNFDFASGISAFNIYALNSSPATSDFWHSYFVKNTGGTNVFGLEFSGNTSYDTKGAILGNKAAPNDTVLVNTNQHLNTNIYDGAGTAATDVFMWEDGQSLSLTGVQNWNAIGGDSAIGWWTNGGATQYFDGKHQELIFYASDKSTDRTSIESNIGDYFTQNTPLLDTYTGAAAAYSLRKLRTAYSGSAIRVRRASDNTEQDIGFNVFGELDTVSLASFCSGTNGFVKTWYDQASTNDATQTATGSQPKIYDSATGVVTENGKPAVEFDGADDRFELDVSASGLNLDVANTSSFHVAQYDNASTDRSMSLSLGGSSGAGRWYPMYMDNGSFEYGYGAVTQVSTETGNTNQNLSTMIAGSTLGQAQAWRNGVSKMTATLATSGIMNDVVGIGVFRTSWYLDGTVQEVVIYNSDQSTNRTNIESNIATFYGITL